MDHDNENSCKGTGRQQGAGIIFKKPLFIMNSIHVNIVRGWSMCSRQRLQTFVRLIYIIYLII